MSKEIEFMVRKEQWATGVSLYGRIDNDVRFINLEPAVFRTMSETEAAMLQPPFLEISINSAQKLIDELWSCGLRPSEGTGSAGSLRATEKHLSDMRKIAFKKLSIDNKDK